MDEQLAPDPVDAAIARLAVRQHGVVSWRQLTELGIGRGAIAWRVKHGRLHPLFRGAYAVGHRSITRRGRWMGAVLAVGPGSVLARRCAAATWDMRPVPRGPVEVWAPGHRRSRSGICVGNTQLRADEVTIKDAIPVTTVARTLLDLAAILPRPQLERAMERAEGLRLADRTSLDDLLRRYPRRGGTVVLRAILATGVAPSLTRSELEDRFLAFLDAHGLPRPHVNGIIEGVEVDFHWHDRRVIVELDGRAAHHTIAAFERDRARDRTLQAAGWRVVRITWHQLQDDPAQIANDLARLLSMPRPHETRRAAVIQA
jgi:hypothetical protein